LQPNSRGNPDVPDYEHILRLSFADVEFLSKALPSRPAEKLSTASGFFFLYPLMSLQPNVCNDRRESADECRKKCFADINPR